MNTPYVKEYNEIGECINPITKETLYLHRYRSMRGQSGRQYINYNNPITGAWIGRVRAKFIVTKNGELKLVPTGNNRKGLYRGILR